MTRKTQVGGRDGEVIVSFGKAPWQIVNADLTITLRNQKITKARVLDANGMPVKDIDLQAGATNRKFAFPPDALYVVLQ